MSTRCDEVESLKDRGCNDSQIQNPTGKKWIITNKRVTNRKKVTGVETNKPKPEEITQIQPQKLRLNLRSGENTFYTVTGSASRLEQPQFYLNFKCDLFM